MCNLPQYRYTGKLDESEFYAHLRLTHKLIVFQDSIYYYDDKCWQRLSDGEARSCLWSAISKEKRGTLSPSVIDKAFKRFIADPANTYDLDSLREKYVNCINVSNGEYNVQTQTLEDHSLTHGFSYVLNFKYVKGANILACKNFINFARTSLDFDSSPSKVKRLLQIIGYCVSSL